MRTHDGIPWTLLAALSQRIETCSDQVFARFSDGRSLTFRELDTASTAFATGLRKAGVEPGHRIMIMASNCLEYLVAFFAAQKRRAILVPVNTELRGAFLEHQVRNSEPTLIVVDAPAAEALAGIGLDGASRLINIEPLRQPNRQAVAFSEMCRQSEATAVLPALPSDICLILYTSGTSGPSKGVLIPQAHAYLFGRQQARALHLTAEDVFFVALPMFHVNALLMSLGSCLLVGARAQVSSRFSASSWMADIRACQATVTNTLGVMAEFVLKQPPSPDDRCHKLRRVMAVPVSQQWAAEFAARFNVQLVQVYGMTECNIVSFSEPGESRAGCVGPISTDYFDVRIVDGETEQPVGSDTVGEIVVRPLMPYAFMQGYFKMAETTVNAWRNLWFHTGDAGVLDHSGKLHFVDRLGDCIRRRGENISSFEVEQVLLAHPQVAECAVVGIKVDGAGGEDEIKAYLVAGGGRIDFGALVAWSAERLPRYAVPRFLEAVDALEKTPTGKIKKRLLRERGLTAASWDRDSAGYRLQRQAATANSGDSRPWKS